MLLGVGSIQSTLYAVRKYLEVRMFHGGRANLIRRSSWQGLQENMIAFNFHDLRIAKKKGEQVIISELQYLTEISEQSAEEERWTSSKVGQEFLIAAVFSLVYVDFRKDKTDQPDAETKLVPFWLLISRDKKLNETKFTL